MDFVISSVWLVKGIKYQLNSTRYFTRPYTFFSFFCFLFFFEISQVKWLSQWYPRSMFITNWTILSVVSLKSNKCRNLRSFGFTFFMLFRFRSLISWLSRRSLLSVCSFRTVYFNCGVFGLMTFHWTLERICTFSYTQSKVRLA